MLTIKKFENIYGIKKLLNPDLIKGNTLIYAPNGVMKTSFADGLEEIAKGIRPKDVFANPPVDGNFEICENEKDITSPSVGCLNILSYHSGKEGKDVFADEALSSLVMSPSLKVKYKTTIDQINLIQDTLNSWLSSELLKEKETSQRGLDILRGILRPNYIVDLINNLPDDFSPFRSSFYSSLPFSVIFNDKTEELLSEKSSFVDKCKDYQISVGKQLDAKVFSSGFGFIQLQTIATTLEKNYFFAAGHKIVLNTMEPMGQKELSDFIKNVLIETYSSQESLNKIEAAKKILEKNSATRALRDLILSQKELLVELAEPEQLRQKIVFSILAEHSSEIASFKVQLANLSETLKSINDEASKTKAVWNKVLDMYNNRFVSNKLDVSISNQTEAVLGMKPAHFVKKIKGTNIEATDLMIDRFSSGEKRALVILSLMYEVELKGAEEFTLVLDDIADSFDYKNKYAIIECLRDFSNKSNMQLIILTHNFDFYRSVKLALGASLSSKLFAYPSKDGISLISAKNQYFDSYSYFNSWKRNGEYPDYLALIPFVRNLSQLTSDGKCPDYLNLTYYLHYSPDTENMTFEPLKESFEKFGVNIDARLDKNYLATLIDETSKMISNSCPPKETDLRSKVIFGLYIRVASDRYMWNKYKHCHNCNPSVIDKFNQSRSLYNFVKSDLTPKGNSTIQIAMTIAPSFIHLNSFMYEPLVDVGSEKMVAIAKDLMDLNK